MSDQSVIKTETMGRKKKENVVDLLTWLTAEISASCVTSRRGSQKSCEKNFAAINVVGWRKSIKCP